MSELTYDFLNEQNEILRDGTDAAFVKASNNILKERGSTKKLIDGQGRLARQFVEKVARQLGWNKEFLRAATLLFGRDYIDARPQSAQDIERVYNNYNLISIPGASSMGKSYVLSVIFPIDYWLDPYGTRIRVASISADHLAGQLFSSMIRCVENSIIDMDMDTSVNRTWIRKKGMTTLDYVIRGQTFKQGDESPSGRFKGVKSEPRVPTKEQMDLAEIFGDRMTRVRILFDESSQMPAGPFLDFDSPLASAGEGVDRVKVMFAFNPDDAAHITAKWSEPENGLETLDADADYEWDSKQGYHVLRLDAAKSENVIARREVYPGIQDYKNFMRLQSQGTDSSAYWTYARGMWPRKGSSFSVIPMVNIIKQKGEVLFTGGTKTCASLDVAFVQDKCVLTVGRWGLANGVQLPNGVREHFYNGNEKCSRPCLQIDTQTPIEMKPNTLELVDEVISLCKDFGVPPEWFVIDKTAIGKGAYDLLTAKFGGVLGVNWQEGASDMKILADDEQIANELYVNISAEMWFCTARWLEHGFMWLSPNIPSNPLYYQLSTRRYLKGRGGKLKVEDKDSYKKRELSGKSSDEADSLCMMPILCRRRGEWLPSVSGKYTEKDGLMLPDIDWKKYWSKIDSPDNLVMATDDAET